MRWPRALAAALLLVAAGCGTSQPKQATSCTSLVPGQNIPSIVQGKSPGTAFCLTAGTYNVSATINLKAGDKLTGPPGQVITAGPASYGVPSAKLVAPTTLNRLIIFNGVDTVSWLDMQGAQITIGMSQAAPGATVSYDTIHGSASNGIGNAHGSILHSNFYGNSTDPASWGFNAAAAKGVDEYQAAYNYVHDNQWNGFWCDVGCNADPSPNGFWVHDNLITNNVRWGVRYEWSPQLNPGVHQSTPTALIEGNSFHGNGAGGVAVADSQNSVVRANTFGAATINGTAYPVDGKGAAVVLVDSGKRTSLWNALVASNTLNGETIKGCTLPSVTCTTNTP